MGNKIISVICIKENIIGKTTIPSEIQAKHNTKVSNKEKQTRNYAYQLAYQELLNQLILKVQPETIYTDIYIAIAVYIDIDQNQKLNCALNYKF